MPLVTADAQRSSQRAALERWLPAVESCLLVLLAFLLLWKGILPGWRTLNTDFPNYYVTARLMHEHYCLDRIYDWIWFQRMADHIGISHQVVGFLGLTPFSALPLLPVSWLPALEAKRIWMVGNIGLLAAAVSLLSWASGLRLRRAWLVALCAVIPLRNDFLLGQMHLLVLLLIAAAYVSHMRGKQVLSGSWIALAAALKIYPIFFCVYFIAKRRWKALGAALLVAACCIALSYLLAGAPAMNAYIGQQLPGTLQGEGIDPFLASATSSAALFHRLFLSEPELNPHPLLQSPTLYAILYPLWQAILAGVVLAAIRLKFRPDRREALEWSAFTVLLLFLSSAPATYHFVVLIAAGVLTLAALLQMGRRRTAAIFLLIYVVACNARTFTPAGWSPGLLTPLLYLKLWAGIGLLLFYLIVLRYHPADENTRDRQPLFSMFSMPVKAAVLISCLWAVSFYSTHRHLKDLWNDGSRRIVTIDDAYLRTQPMPSFAGLSYVAMTRGGYKILNSSPRISSWREAEDGDELSFATSPESKSAWIEVASGSGSRLVRVSPEEKETCQIGDAEDPVLFADESLLAFLREDHGHGSLWSVDPHLCGSNGATPAPQRLTPASYDVRTLGHGGWRGFAFSAVYKGSEALFSITPGGLPQPITSGNATLDAPSLTPDGKMLIARKLVKARWQLVSLDLSSQTERQLTFGDCNAYAPAWKDEKTLLYATDCGRGIGFSTLAWVSASP